MATYAAMLMQNVDKGKCGDAEVVEDEATVAVKVSRLAELLLRSRHCIVHTGAGVSTAAGVHDFRGPNGVWTREELGLDPLPGVAFEQAIPTLTHRAIVSLIGAGVVKHVVSQNIDGLHIRSGLSRDRLSEVHGTLFAEWCDQCLVEFRRSSPVETIGLRSTGNRCPRCGADLRDMLCDWNSDLPAHEVDRAIAEHRRADLCICVGSSMRIRPAGLWPQRTLRRNGKPAPGQVCIVNLQKTHLDRLCAVRIFAKADHVFSLLMKELGLGNEPGGSWETEDGAADQTVVSTLE